MLLNSPGMTLLIMTGLLWLAIGCASSNVILKAFSYGLLLFAFVGMAVQQLAEWLAHEHG